MSIINNASENIQHKFIRVPTARQFLQLSIHPYGKPIKGIIVRPCPSMVSTNHDFFNQVYLTFAHKCMNRNANAPDLHMVAHGIP